MARNAFIPSLNYPGSSGYWATSGSGISGDAGRGGYDPVLGYPGDAARRAMPSAVTPSRYGATATASRYNPLAITKNPWLKDFVGGLQSDLSKTSALPDFTQVLNSLKADQRGINTAFDRYGNAVNLDDYIGAQRGGDAELRARTNALSGDVGALGSRYGDVLADYENSGLDSLGRGDALTDRYVNETIPEGMRIALANAATNTNKWQMGQQGGGSSALVTLANRTATEAALPWLAEGQRMRIAQNDKRIPFYGDVASRQSNKITGFDYPATAAMYDRYGNLISTEKGTAANIQQLQMAVAREGVDMAIRRYVTDFQSAQMLAQAANLPVEVIMQRAQAAGALGGMSPLYQYEGLQGPEAWLQSPTGYNNSLPGYPPSRYGTRTGNAQDGTGPNARGWQDWNQSGAVGSPTQPYGTLEGDIARGLPSWALDQRYGTDRSRRPSNDRSPAIPFDPNYTSGGWGYVNGEYIGANADSWNENMYGPVVQP